MPSTVSSLLASVSLVPSGCVPWGEPVPETRAGVYVVSTTSSATKVDQTHASYPVDMTALERLLAICPSLTLDAVRPTASQLAERLSAYWITGESVLYIGLAGQPLKSRVGQYYRTSLGAAKPHKGGWWLKTLAICDQLSVHFAVTADFKNAEEEMMRAFARGVSPSSLAALPASEPVMPFANLRDGDWRRRRHGIRGETTTNATATPSRPSRAAKPPTGKKPAALDTSSGPRPLDAARTRLARYRSRPVTANDIEAGQIRLSGPVKTMFPRERQDVAIVLRGKPMTCRWDPRYGPPERSGVLRVGKAATTQFLGAGDVLEVFKANGFAHLDR
jgi:hypothetical protein